MFNRFFMILILTGFLIGCTKNDDFDQVQTVPARNRGEVQRESDSLLRNYLSTHFYNYEAFVEPSEDFGYKIVFDTIAGENSDKIPLLDQVETQLIAQQGQQEKLYILKVREGAGTKSTNSSSTTINYEGRHVISGKLFDKSTQPFPLQLSRAIPGFGNAVANFRAASTFTKNADGTASFSNDYGIGAVFVPTGLAYFNLAAGPIAPYENLIFTFDLLQVLPN